MKIRHLRVRNYRCIGTLDWIVGGSFLCLVGPGDSGKSTILDAIEAVLSPRWNLAFDDSDFHQASTTEPLIIEATLGELPRKVLSDRAFGTRVRGFTSEGTIRDEPDDDDEHVLTIRLTVDRSLEPVWEVVTERHPEGAPIHASDRERFGAVRLGALVDRHLSWSRGSALARLTGETDEHAEMLADVGRQARESMDVSRVPKLDAASKQAASLASAFGVSATNTFAPALDAATPVAAGGLSLHDGPVPLRRAGLGTRRLVALAVQRELVKDGGLILIDELEQGLEPYRVRRLVAELLLPTVARTREDPTGPASASRFGAVAVTSHSPIVLGELEPHHLQIVRRDGSAVRVHTPAASVRSLLRAQPDAFLCRKVIVCEGKTELGVLRGIDSHQAQHREPYAAKGTAFADGGGSSKVGKLARSMTALGYSAAVLADSDQPLDVPPTELTAEGVPVVQWSGGLTIEQRVFEDLPWDGIVEALALAVEEHGNLKVRDQWAEALSVRPREINHAIYAKSEQELRASLGLAAKKKGNEWYKRVDLGEALGNVVARHLPAIPHSDLAVKIALLEAWIYADA